MIATINFGPHTHPKLSKPSFELITIFENFGQKSSKIGLHLASDLFQMDPIL